jgi:hypothetical protein
MNEKSLTLQPGFPLFFFEVDQAASTVTTLFKTSTVPPFTAKVSSPLPVRTSTSPD